jgi:putative ABC transport system permease protein
MVRNYLKTAWRHIRRNKLSFALNLSGLSIGIACALLLLLYVGHELSYDRHDPNADRIYRLACSTRMGNAITEFAALPPAVGPALKEAIPEIVQVARFQHQGKLVVKKGNELFTEEGVYFADSSLLSVFGYRFIWGNAQALREKNSILITRSLAERLFKEQLSTGKGPLGEKVNLSGYDFLVSGVIENPPPTSHFRFNALVAWHTFGFADVWDDAHAYTYIQLREGANEKEVTQKIDQFVAHNAQLRELAEKLDAHISVIVQPLTAIHLHSHFLGELSPGGSMRYVYLFALMALFFLLCAGINYVNLAIAGSANRSKEIGVRKVLGAGSGAIRKQFLADSLLLTFFASLIGLGLVWLSLGHFNRLTETTLSLDLLRQPPFALAFLGLVVLIGLLSGAYPAFYLSRLDPVRVLKSQAKMSSGHLSLRKALVIVQFAMAIVMICATMLVTAQMNFISQKELGFVKENVLVVPIPMRQNLEYFKAEILKQPQVLGAAACNYVPGNAPKDEHRIERQGGDMKVSTVHRLHFDAAYLNLLSMPIVQGRGFDSTRTTDYSEAFLVNEAAVRAFGWDAPGESPIGKKIDGFNYGKQGAVIGVVKDIHLFSLRQQIEPIVMNLSLRDYNWGESVYIRLKGDRIRETVAGISKTYARVFNGYPFEYSFMDDQYDRLYRTDQRMSATLQTGAVLMVVLSCLGIFGLSAFIALQKTKETAIRKVLGASLRELWRLHIKAFALPVLLANIIAWPLVFWLMRIWLQEFAYQIDISLVFFVLGGGLTLLIVVATVSLHAYRTARINPVRYLRNE